MQDLSKSYLYCSSLFSVASVKLLIVWRSTQCQIKVEAALTVRFPDVTCELCDSNNCSKPAPYIITLYNVIMIVGSEALQTAFPFVEPHNQLSVTLRCGRIGQQPIVCFSRLCSYISLAIYNHTAPNGYNSEWGHYALIFVISIGFKNVLLSWYQFWPNFY